MSVPNFSRKFTLTPVSKSSDIYIYHEAGSNERDEAMFFLKLYFFKSAVVGFRLSSLFPSPSLSLFLLRDATCVMFLFKISERQKIKN